MQVMIIELSNISETDTQRIEPGMLCLAQARQKLEGPRTQGGREGDAWLGPVNLVSLLRPRVTETPVRVT